MANLRKIFAAELTTRSLKTERKIVAMMATITTANVDNAGTDANVYFEVAGKNTLLDKPGYNDFERGDTDTYAWYVERLTLGDLRTARIRLHHDNTGNRPGWYVAKVTLQVQFADSSLLQTYKTWGPIGWLAKDEPPYYSTEAILQDGSEA
jgi:hypothetical protein